MNKLCPFRKETTIEDVDEWTDRETEEFLQCIGKECMAYKSTHIVKHENPIAMVRSEDPIYYCGLIGN